MPKYEIKSGKDHITTNEIRNNEDSWLIMVHSSSFCFLLIKVDNKYRWSNIFYPLHDNFTYSDFVKKVFSSLEDAIEPFLKNEYYLLEAFKDIDSKKLAVLKLIGN